jgi:hypothetical protein
MLSAPYMLLLILDVQMYMQQNFYASAPFINNGIFRWLPLLLLLDSGFDAVHTEHEHSVGTETDRE